jgi:ubiquinone/menaquinone biosynthesis C-methylase UbiE
MDTDKIVSDFYDSEEEDNRFSSKYGMVEYIITRKYIDKYLRLGDRILEVGCGTGRYSLHYAHKGYKVDAVELVQSNLDVLWQNTLKTDNICAIQGNALDLSIYPDDTFNITLVLGPMYHLFTSEDKLKCLKEAERVTKKSGIIFIAYCQFDASMIQNAFIQNNYNFLVENKLLDESTYLPISNPAGIFELYRKKQIDQLNETLNVQRLHYVGTDMYSHYYETQINNMDEILYQKYIEYTATICENQNLVGLSNHTLDILKKV